MKGEEDEEEELQHEIGFLEGIDFLGAKDRKLNRERKRKEETQQKAKLRKRGKKKKRSTMHEHVMCKNNCIMGKNPIQTTALTLFNQAHNLEYMKT